MKRVLVIGADSVIGRRLFHDLRSKTEIECVGTSRRRDSSEKTMFFDITQTSYDSISKFDIAIIFIGVTGNQKCKASLDSWMINVNKTVELVDYLISVKTKVIWISSSAVFKGDIPVTVENQIKVPANLYGLQKSIVEDQIMAHGYLDSRVAIVRITKVVDPDFWPISRIVAKDMELVCSSDIWISPVSIRYVSSCLTKLISIFSPGLFSISGQENISYFDFASLVKKRAGNTETTILKQSHLSSGTDSPVCSHATLPGRKMLERFGVKRQSIDSVICDSLSEVNSIR